MEAALGEVDVDVDRAILLDALRGRPTGKKDTLKPLGVPGPGSLISPSSPLPSARVAVELNDSNRSCQTRSDLSPGQSTPLAVGLQAPPPCGLCARLRHADKRCRTHSARKII